MIQFRDFPLANGLVDLRASAAFHTWANCQFRRFISKKLDRVMCNDAWVPIFSNAEVSFFD